MSYMVVPVKVALQADEWSRSWFSPANLGCSGCVAILSATGALSVAASLGLLAAKEGGTWFLWGLLGTVVAYLLITLSVYLYRKAQLSRAEASKATADAQLLLKGVKEHSAYLSYRAQTAAQSLKAAEFELKEEAFAPFWDAVEAAASALGECHASCQWLSTSVPQYEGILRGREHTFPDCFEDVAELPDCQPLLNELYRLVRQAQRDFRFANIWEHRQTRKVMIAGFATLGEAIRSLEATVVRSMADLKKAVEERALQPSPTDVAKRIALRFILPFP